MSSTTTLADSVPQAQPSSGTPASPSPSSSQSVQMKRALAGQPYDVQMAMLDPHATAVQMHGGGAEDTASVHEAAEAGTQGGGASLPHLDKIQAAFGAHDVSGVQAYTGGAATQANQAMGAEAYATGDKIAFAGAPDVHTAAHEAAHVVQQEHGVSLSGGVGQAGDGYEQHADRVADAVVSGKDASPILDQMTGGGGGESVQQKVQKKEGDAVQRVETTPVVSPRAPAGAEVNLTGASMGAPSTENPNFERDATQFETNLGGLAMSQGSAHAATMAAKAMTYMQNKAAATVTATEGLKAKLDALLITCGTAGTSFAGAVGVDPTTIQFICSDIEGQQRIVAEALAAGKAVTQFQSPGNLREQMTLLYNFGTKIVGPDLLADGAGKVSTLLGSTDAQKAALEAKVVEVRALAAERSARELARGTPAGDRRASPDAGIGDVAWGVPNRPPAGAGAAGAAPPPLGTSGAITGDATPAAGGGSTTAPVPAAAATPRAVVGQDNARVNRTALNDSQDPSRTAAPDSNSDRAYRGRQGADAPQTQSGRTAADLAPGAGLSERETAHMSLAPGDVLKWSEGDKTWFMNEKDSWIEAIRSLGLPLGGGPSGTTTAIMNTNELIAGTSAENARLCAIGYLLPIHAHTLVEILAAAAAFGPGFTAGRQMYMSLPPLGAEQLRNLGRAGPAGKLFPHEPDPPPPAPAPAPGAAPGSAPGGAPGAAPAAPASTSGAGSGTGPTG